MTTEREVAVLFFDARFGGAGGAQSAEAASAHDTIYALDNFHAIASAAIESAEGVQCGHTGNSWMALFGLDAGGVHPACIQALVAAQQIEERSAVLTNQLGRELGFDADFSIGVHVGLVVAGMIGKGETRRLSAVGDAIRVAEQPQGNSRQKSGTGA